MERWRDKSLPIGAHSAGWAPRLQGTLQGSRRATRRRRPWRSACEADIDRVPSRDDGRDDGDERMRIRAARGDDGMALREIERGAGERFRDVALATIADAEPASVEELARYADAGRSWVAVDGAGVPIGYVLVDEVDGNAHVEQMSVHPSFQGRGVGRALLERVGGWAVATGCPALTLTTYADVPWNAPLYEHLGFRVLDAHEVGPELAAVREAEKAAGLDIAERVCMRRDVVASSQPEDPRNGGTP